jgi:hypothetical protein
MKRNIVFAFSLAWCTLGIAAVQPGENLVVNGSLDADQVEFPPFWNLNSRSKKHVIWHPSGGPGGLPYLTINGEKEPDIRVQQFGLDLVSNGTYRISMKVRTRNFRSGSHTGIMLVNSGLWRSTEGVMSLPANTDGDWKVVSKEFKCFSAPDGYMVLLRILQQKGELDVADIRLEAVDDLALKESGPSKMIACELHPRLVPLMPLLSKIPSDDPHMKFRFFGKLEKSDDEYEVFADIKDKCARIVAPLSREAVILSLPESVKEGQVEVGLIDKATGKKVVSRCYNFRVVPSVPKSSSYVRRQLNNLCAEVLTIALLGREKSKHSFSLTRDGWVYIAVKDSETDAVEVKVDGKLVISAATPRAETFRLLSAGEHVLDISGASEGSVVVREIAEILNYCPGVNSYVTENTPYDWAFNDRYVLPAVTTQLGGKVPNERLAEFNSRGYKWMYNMNLTGCASDIMIKKLSECRGMTNSNLYGVACDEQNYADVVSLDAYANGFWMYDIKESPTKPIYTWAYGKPTLGAVSFDFLAACINIAGGTGKLIREHYCSTAETEENASKILRNYVGSTFEMYRKMCPDAFGSLGLVFGNFNQVPILSKAHHPEVDYKYYLDMQMNFAANDPLFKGIGLVGYWGSYYADEELHRWSFALTRHYVVEGNTNMLSAAHGFRYRPDHLLNGDFRGTVEPWKTTGTVRLDSHATFASRSQNRWGGSDGVGDTFAVLVREEGKTASISQKIGGLSVGRKYCLQFATFDVKDVKANRVAPRRFGVSATLGDGAKIDASRSWVHVDRRIKGRYATNDGVARINLHHTVFVAESEEIDLTIDNAAAEAGEELGVNYVSLNPYFD